MSDDRTTRDAPRVLTVLVDQVAIADGQIDPPEVGAVTSFPLMFHETQASEPDVVTVRGELEPVPGPPVQRGDGLTWSGLLRGDGWTASWDGRRPRTGRVEVTGQFLGVMGIDATGHVRGRVTTVQVVSMFWKRVDTRARWEPLARRRDYRRVERSPRFFSDERMFTDDPPDVSRSEIGVLITLDLDDVPDLPLRPHLVAGDVSASENLVWALDRVLPAATCFGDDGTRTTYLLPAAVTPHRKVWSTPTGCWISGRDGIFRIDVGSEIGRQVSNAGATVGAVHGEQFLACTTAEPWRIHTPDGTAIVVDTPAGTPIAAVTDGATFVVLLSSRDGNARNHRLIRITAEGASHAGPLLPTPEDRYASEPDLLPDPLMIARDDTFTSITRLLTAAETRRVPRRFFQAGVVGGHIWTIGHPPDRTSRSWWPLDGPTTYDLSRGQFWLLTILDRDTLNPAHTAAVQTSQPALTQDAAGTIWLTAAGKLQKIVNLGGTMSWPESAT